MNMPFVIKASVVRGGNLPALVQYFHELQIKTIQIGGIMERGRCITTCTRSMDINRFVEQFTKAFELGKSLGLEVAPLWSLGLANSCGLCSLMVVTTDGHITACPNVLDGRDKGVEVFVYGRIDEEGHVLIDEHKLRLLRSRTVNRLSPCKKCFAKWNCGGGCATAAYQKTGSVFSVEPEMCTAIRKATAYMLDKVLRSYVESDLADTRYLAQHV